AIQLIGSVADGVVINSEGNILFLGTTAAVPPETPPTFTLTGSLIDATNARIVSGNGTATRATVVIHDGATLTKTDSAALVSLATTNLVAPGAVLSLRRSPTAGQRSTLNLAT